ncbi:amidase [Nocardia bovistercoris]|uniref:amidase n=1 Tax=Nocardia bovistercoris TaxID=2785916 RepID=UPI002FCCE7E2
MAESGSVGVSGSVGESGSAVESGSVDVSRSVDVSGSADGSVAVARPAGGVPGPDDPARAGAPTVVATRANRGGAVGESRGSFGGLVRDRTAIATVAAVHEGLRTPTEIVAEALVRMVERDRKINAFTVVREERARRDAVALEQRSDLDVLPMAGVPVAVERSLAVAGEAVPRGSGVAESDHPAVTRLRAAGAVVTGLTGTSEFGLWPLSDDTEPLTRNPWNRVRGSAAAAAAVAAGAVPVATAADGVGAVRVGAACAGVFGIKPGRYVAPALIGLDSWGGLAENGVLATSVADAALALSVLAARPDLADLDPPDRLRIGVAVDPPHRMFRVDRQWTAAAMEAAELAAADGHTVEPVVLPQGPAALAALLRWYTAELPREDLPEQPERLQPRTRRHLAVGRAIHRLGLVRPAQIDRIESRLLELFEHYDVVITPTLAAPPPRARNNGARGRLADLLALARFTPFTPIWNLVGWPAASVPMGTHTRSRTPVAAQLAGPPGAESTLLRLAARLEARKPWRRLVR